MAILLLFGNTVSSRKLILKGKTLWVNLMVSWDELRRSMSSLSFSFP